MTTIEKLSEEDINELRLMAHDIISKLYLAEARSHLRLLLNHCQSSLLSLNGKEDDHDHD